MSTAPLKLDLEHTPIDRGVTLIEASAGTGKTYCLTGLVLRLLLERHVPGVGSILVMTFTNAATAELIARIRTALRAAVRVFEGDTEDADGFLLSLGKRHGAEGLKILEAALRDLDDLEVCTIHGFCRRVLQQHAFETGTPFDVEYVEDSASLLERVSLDYWRRVLYPAGDLVAAIGVHRGWRPEFLTTAYEKCRNHPGVVIEPEPLRVSDALARLQEAAEVVRQAWNRSELERALGTLKYSASTALTGSLLEQRLAELEAFSVRGVATAVSAVLDTCSDALLERLTKAGKTQFQAFEFCIACDRLSAAVNGLEHALKCAFFRDAVGLLEAEKRATGTAGFDDLLHRLYHALLDPMRADGLRRTTGRQFRAVLVDEFQDTDSIQYGIFQSLFTDACLFFIGDPKQAIYGFRGADVFAYIRAKRDAARLYTLNENWRSESRLVNAVTAVFRHSPQPFRHAEIPFIDVKAAGKADEHPMQGDARAPLQWIWIGRHGNKIAGAKAACRATVDEITALVSTESDARIGDCRVQPKHITVLVRTNKQATQIQDALHAVGIPAVVSRSGNVFETEEASDLRTLLRAVLAPRDARALRAALATRAWGHAASDIAELAENDDEWQTTVEHFEALRDTWVRDGFVPMMQRLIDAEDVRIRLLSSTRGERRLTNLLHLIELANAAAAEHHFSPEALTRWLSGAIASPREHDTDATELRLESDAEAVQIVTVHKSKGLEYDVVFCPFWDGHKPKSDPPLLIQLDDGRSFYVCEGPIDDQRLRSFQEETLSEEARVAYVALTRAKHRCYVVWGQIGDKPESSALAQLLHEGRKPETKDWRTELGAFCDTHAGLTGVYDCGGAVTAEATVRTTEPPPSLRARDFPSPARLRLEPWKVASFSSFTTRAAARASAPELPDYSDPAEATIKAMPPARGIAGFARGAAAGTCLHEILEHCDFTCATDADTAKLVTNVLRKHRLDESRAHAGDPDPAKTVRGMLADLTATELPGAGFSLAQVTREARLNEWQFYLSMGPVSQRRLAQCFARHGSGEIGSMYPAMLESLGERDVRGFLTGFVDLVFTHDDRWYLVDWKSNHLGPDASDYDDASLARTMRDHHYVLQYHLYALALDRYLKQRLVGYDHGRHFGGAYYAFLRGIRPGMRTGWYVDRPSRAILDALDAMMREGAGS